MPDSQAEKSHFEQHPFRLTEVNVADAPDGGDSGRWCQYIITQGKNRIVGYSQGSLRTVKRDALAKVEELNRRRYGGKAPKSIPKATPKPKA